MHQATLTRWSSEWRVYRDSPCSWWTALQRAFMSTL